LNDTGNAIKFYQQVISEKKSQFAPRAISRMAELELTAKNYSSAVNYYLQSLANARNKRDQFTAWTGLMDAYYGQSKYDSVVYFADQIVNTGNATLSAQNKAMLYRGKVAFAQGNYDKAVDEFLKTLNSAQDENGAEAQYLMGEAQFKQKQYKQSLETLFQLNKNFAAYEKWRGKGFLLIADNYVALNELFQAKATLNSIIENAPDKELVTTARAKLKDLESRPQQIATPDTVSDELEDEQ
jgi:tetratricopeptide (TPR) repeat protein